MSQLIDLPWQTQLIIVSGYVGYALAYSGRRGNHDAFDTAAITLCFGSIALFILSFDEKLETLVPFLPKQFLPIFALLGSLLGGAIWRSFLASWAKCLVRKISKSDEDGLPSAWTSVIQKQNLKYSQLIVTLKSGRVLESYPLGNFNDWPNGPCVLGADGSIAMYVTNIEENGLDRETRGLTNSDGMRITYIPSDQILEVDFKRIG